MVKLDGPAQIEFSWTGGIPAGGPGRVVLRLDRGLQRWDDVTKDSDEPTQGSFTVYQTVNDRTSAFGCAWIAVPGDRSKVRSECGKGDASPSGAAVLTSLALLNRRESRQVRSRTILGEVRPCYGADGLGGGITELCVDARGRILYLSLGSPTAVGLPNVTQTFEATSVSDVVERVDWLPEADPSLASNNFTIHSRTELQLPRDFNLPPN